MSVRWRCRGKGKRMRKEKEKENNIKLEGKDMVFEMISAITCHEQNMANLIIDMCRE